MPPPAFWRPIADRAKRSPLALRLADHLGRGVAPFRLPFPNLFIPPAPLTPDLSRWHELPLAAIWLGHASMLFRIAGQTVLADPVFSPRIGLQLGPFTLGPKRHQRPPIPLNSLPPIDLLLISHAHFDHLDRPTLHRLSKHSPHARLLTAPHCSDLLSDLRFSPPPSPNATPSPASPSSFILHPSSLPSPSPASPSSFTLHPSSLPPSPTELPPHTSLSFGSLTITSLPTKHWGARVFHDTHRSHIAFLLHDTATHHKILFGSDTAYHDAWNHLALTGGVDLACLGIGAYNPYLAAHASPEQAAQLARQISARTTLPIHHSTFNLSHEPMPEPLERFLAASQDLTLAPPQIGSLWTPTSPTTSPRSSSPE